ncbi:AAA family ATPase [Pseudonocardia abyssalis]|uniref:SMC family ATPase n=1 Tax=Pseudonocardia abyssalis TaxID=2792008 RepID=A0ABS6UM00_9PSEU|nr:SMC family ATPase [Pseudonocardia abyssalis]MBW0115277.1 SMC family ATPase [Pseudonocardia abyssalis]MBW0132956.1 SMC family ATPase [Pseudonocardia abyssalis]
MRPVLLELDGFASFREPTVVDFTGAEYFALVGPTGSGKSTIIDAITFALYGSVPRWDNQRTVALALAPTAGRGTVKLVFDVGGARYVAARELRRAASGSVSVRSARLERLRDPSGTAGVDEETEPLADGAGGVTSAVEELLGLPFGDFTTCVVLPQGDFAEFLHTEPRKRQEKLVRILGLGLYDQIAREANSESAAQRQRAEVLSEQLTGYADATPAAEAAAQRRVDALVALTGRVDALVPRIEKAAAEQAAAEADAARIRAEGTVLAALTAPDGLADLDARRAATATALSTAAVAHSSAEAEDGDARDALAAAPERGPLELVRSRHAELAALTGDLPGLRDRHAKSLAAFDTAARDAADARTALDTARAARDTATVAATTAADTVRRLISERDGLRALAVPAGLDALGRRRSAAVAALAEADSALAAAESADARARDALDAAPARGPLEQARREHAERASVLQEQEAAVARRADAERAVAAAAERVRAARHALDHAEARRADGQRADLAAALRPALAVGEPCPVCAQAVATLPPAGAEPDPGAERAVVDAVGAHDAARTEEAAASSALARAAADADRLDSALQRLRPEPDAATVEQRLDGLAEAERTARDADTAVRAARRARETEAREVDTVRAETQGAAAALRTARDPLVPFGAPAVSDDDVLAGWTALVWWASEQAADRDTALTGARAAVAVADGESDAASSALHAADRAATDRRAEETAAARAEQEARGAVDGVQARLGELRTALDGAPSDADAARSLERRSVLEDAARTSDAALRSARAALRAAEREAAQVADEVGAAWSALRAARDPLVPLGAPAVTGDDLRAAWDRLAGWASDAAADRRTAWTAADAAARSARESRDTAVRALVDDLAAHDLALPPARPDASRPDASRPDASRPDASRPDASRPDGPHADPGAARSTVAAAVERARAAHARLAERRDTVARITADRDAAEEAQQVAKMLGGLLRSDGFPRWLVASALDALVADASTSLAELSGGQFALTHDNGEFLVIDHADADAKRPVKTLSGGETFQASLALALALSAQMSGLAARGAARLESIFLDEGFGTLDEANLEVVASTLENLAARGDRMVGVVTHVPALAERVPVRFRVARDQRTSSVTRENL